MLFNLLPLLFLPVLNNALGFLRGNFKSNPVIAFKNRAIQIIMLFIFATGWLPMIYDAL